MGDGVGEIVSEFQKEILGVVGGLAFTIALFFIVIYFSVH